MRTDTGMQYAFYLRWPTDLLRCNLQLMACYHVWHMRATNRHPARWICIHQAPRQRAWHPPHPRQGRCVLNATTGMTGSTFRAQSNILLEHLFPLEATSPLLKAPNSSCGVATPRRQFEGNVSPFREAEPPTSWLCSWQCYKSKAETPRSEMLSPTFQVAQAKQK